MEKLKNWVKNNKIEFIILVTILATGAFLRLYKIGDYMTFLGDEGRDAIVVSRFLKYFDIMLIGPGTSIGNMYLGPFYYYMMAIPLLVSNFSPVGPAVMVALLGVATIALVWWVGREWFLPKAALLAATLYAISPTIIVYSRSSWNPNVMPFFALLCIYSIWKVYKENNFQWLIILGISFAFVLQSHYLGLLLLPTLGLFWYLTKNKNREFKKKFLITSIIFILLMSPLVIFDARHGWRNFAAMGQFFSVKKDAVTFKPWFFVSKIWPIYKMSITSLVTAKINPLGVTTSIGLASYMIWSVIKKKNLLLVSWLGFGILGLSVYKGQIYDHYFGFVFPAIFLLIGALIYELSQIKKQQIFFPICLYVYLSVLVAVNLWNTPIRKAPNMQLPRSIMISRFIEEKAGGERFNIATISKNSNRDVYQYFLSLWDAKVVDTDPSAVAYTVTNQLFVVCEMPKEKCDPTHDPSAWITNFGWTKIIDQWEVWGTNIYKLGHTK
ncbi:MAG: hypothetical protein A2417_03310 [Bdellovibrionales bacterium RIFOXYC1_FULL_37_79]|nr:MAG: hypothetical protein UR41_C0021G0006 [Candidatus Woesebacteria bacterium GW2011_GWA1_33_33]OFZ48556.1 MAG: hypothetical protein A2417_03310 [Bdellovibrionales bacterium RIFOXYC1_FULL_37_79]